MEKLRILGRAILMEIREHKSSFAAFVTLRLLVLVMMCLQLANRNYENVFLCLLTLLLMIVPSFIQVGFRVEIPSILEITILLFIFAAEILGEISSFYIKYPIWDTMLHTINGFLAAAIGFSMVDLLNRNERFMFKLSPVFMAVVAFSISMTIGVIWEFFEFGMDTFLGFDMQKDTIIHEFSSVMLDPTDSNIPVPVKDITSVAVNGHDLGLNGYLDIGLIDTMKDLFVNFIGAFVYSVIGFFYVKNRGKGKGRLAGGLILKIKSDDADFLRIATEHEAADHNAVGNETTADHEEKMEEPNNNR